MIFIDGNNRDNAFTPSQSPRSDGDAVRRSSARLCGSRHRRSPRDVCRELAAK